VVRLFLLFAVGLACFSATEAKTLGALLQEASALVEQDKNAEAEAVLAEAARDFPESFEARYNLALIRLVLGKVSEAAADTAAIPNPGRHQAAFDYLRGKIAAASHDEAKAEHFFTAAHEAAPDDETYALDLALFYIRKQAFVRATPVVTPAVAAHPTSPYLLLTQATAQAFGGDQSAAIRTLSRILRSQPDFAPASLLLAYSFYRQGNFAESVKSASQAISKGPANPYLLYVRASSQLRLDSPDMEAAIRDLDGAIALLPACAPCYLERAKACERLREDAAAVQDYETVVLRLDPGCAQAWHRLGSLYRRLRRTADADYAFRRVRELKSQALDRDETFFQNAFTRALELR
jgi:tetratricopeptide (TPR) repeat protein